MALRSGIVGLPNVGKSTLFNAISNAHAEAANFPFCTIEPNVGVVMVPDERLNVLKELVQPEKAVPTTIEFVDIAGLVKGASKGEGLGNQFLANIREVNAIIHVIRCFENDNVVHVDGRVNPVFDKEIIDTELQLKDLESVERRINRIEKTAKSGDKEAKKELEILMILKAGLENGKNIRQFVHSEEHLKVVNQLQLLTNKPVIYVANVSEDTLPDGNKHVETLRESLKGEDSELIVVSASIESQIVELDDPEERKMFLREYGLKESGLDKMIHATYNLLHLITFFTVGPKEVRAWTVKKGSKAPRAAGEIHTDFERGFIKAEVIKFEDYASYKTEQAVREAGKLKIEGKDYIVQDGDVIFFKFNV